MKAIALATLLVSLLFLTSCTVSKDFEFDLEKDMLARGSATQYSTSATIYADSLSSDFRTYKSDIQDIQVMSATYLVHNFFGVTTQTIDSATLFCGAPTDSIATTVVGTIHNVMLYLVNGTEQDLPLNEAGKTTLKNLIMNNPNATKLSFSGASDVGPINFNVTFKVHIKVTYEKSIL